MVIRKMANDHTSVTRPLGLHNSKYRCYLRLLSKIMDQRGSYTGQDAGLALLDRRRKSG